MHSGVLRDHGTRIRLCWGQGKKAGGRGSDLGAGLGRVLGLVQAKRRALFTEAAGEKLSLGHALLAGLTCRQSWPHIMLGHDLQLFVHLCWLGGGNDHYP